MKGGYAGDDVPKAIFPSVRLLPWNAAEVVKPSRPAGARLKLQAVTDACIVGLGRCNQAGSVGMIAAHGIRHEGLTCDDDRGIHRLWRHRQVLKIHCLLQVVGVDGTDPAVQDGQNGAEAMDVDGEDGALLPAML